MTLAPLQGRQDRTTARKFYTLLGRIVRQNRSPVLEKGNRSLIGQKKRDFRSRSAPLTNIENFGARGGSRTHMRKNPHSGNQVNTRGQNEGFT
jgi:hypothetical protein